MSSLSKEQIDRWAARIVAIFKNGQKWEDTHELEQSYVRGVVEGIASDVSKVVDHAAIQASYNVGFDIGYKEARAKAAVTVDPPVGGPTAA
jgi:hypothetical protein